MVNRVSTENSANINIMCNYRGKDLHSETLRFQVSQIRTSLQGI